MYVLRLSTSLLTRIYGGIENVYIDWYWASIGTCTICLAVFRKRENRAVSVVFLILRVAGSLNIMNVGARNSTDQQPSTLDLTRVLLDARGEPYLLNQRELFTPVGG